MSIGTSSLRKHSASKSVTYLTPRLVPVYQNFKCPDRLLPPDHSNNRNPNQYFEPKSVSQLTPSFLSPVSVIQTTPSSPNFLARNMNLEQFLPQNKRDLLKYKAMIEQKRIEKTLKQKHRINKDKKKDKLKKIKEKHNKFKMQIQHEEVKLCANTWLTLFTISTSALFLNYKKLYLKALRKRSEKLLRFLRTICRSIGKIRIMLRKKKINQALEKIGRFSLRVKRWVRRKKKKYIQILNQVIYKAAGREKIFRFMFHWRSCLTFIQRMWKKMNIEKKISLALRVIYWDKIEKNLIETQQSIRENKGQFKSLVSHFLKEKLIKDLLKKRVKQYCKNINRFRDKKKIEGNKGIENLKTLIRANSIRIEKPRPNYVFSRKDYIKLMQQAAYLRKNSKVLMKIPTVKVN